MWDGSERDGYQLVNIISVHNYSYDISSNYILVKAVDILSALAFMYSLVYVFLREKYVPWKGPIANDFHLLLRSLLFMVK